MRTHKSPGVRCISDKAVNFRGILFNLSKRAVKRRETTVFGNETLRCRRISSSLDFVCLVSNSSRLIVDFLFDSPLLTTFGKYLIFILRREEINEPRHTCLTIRF